MASNCVIIVPCYNEEHRLQVPSFVEFVRERHDVSFLFVNDGSTDGTLRLLHDICCRNADRCGVLDLQRNCGKGEAVREGFLAAFASSPEFVGFWDADLATPLDAIPDLLDVLGKDQHVEIVLGARVMLMGRDIRRRAVRHYLGRVFATAASIAVGLPVYDTQCGAKIFRVTKTLHAIFAEPFLSRWIFDVEILARWLRERADQAQPLNAARFIHEFPLRVWRDVGESKVTKLDFLRSAWELRRIRTIALSRPRRVRRGRGGRSPPSGPFLPPTKLA